MSLFAKNKPTKRVNFEGGWVELQHLTKGAKDEIASRLSSLYKGLDKATLEQLQGTDELPDSMVDSVGMIQQAEYYMLFHAIKAWSEPVEISEETVKELSEEVFTIISKEVKVMNGLSKTEEKN